MRKLFIRFGVAVVFAFILVAVVGIFLPQKYVLARSVVIDAEPARVHAFVEDLDQWPTWGPWAEGDPSLTITPGPIRIGVGASNEWIGRDGQGELAITAADVASGIEYDLYFNQRQFSSKGAFTYVPQAEKTEVTWALTGDVGVPVFGGYVALFMDHLMGSTFEAGLKKLKQQVEAQQ